MEYQYFNDNEKRFINALYIPYKQGFNPMGVYTQGYLESGAFSSALAKENNFWGIKKPKNWKGGVYRKQTIEMIDGKSITIEADFIAFASEYQAMTFYCNLIKKLYPCAYEKRNEPVLFFRGLISGGNKWSTSPTYDKDLEKLYNRLMTKTALVEEIERKCEG